MPEYKEKSLAKKIEFVRQSIPLLFVLIKDKVYLFKDSEKTPWYGDCPFCLDGRFNVNEDKGIYWCMNCAATGGVLEYVAQRERRSIAEAAAMLIAAYELKLPNVNPRKKEVDE